MQQQNAATTAAPSSIVPFPVPAPGRDFFVRFIDNEKGNPPGKVADVELHFSTGPLAGLKLIGFALWERRGGGGINVTYPARQYSVNGERRSFALLRPRGDEADRERLTELIRQAYAEHVAQLAAAAAAQ